jgi:molybdopterin synthase catalytic subunit/molybdopterin converting factor small subunit
MSMTLQVKLFAMLKERAGRDRIEVELAEGATVGDLLAELSDLIGMMPVRVAVNREYGDDRDTLRSGDELALIPPVSGGSGEPAVGPDVHAAVRDEPLSLDLLARMVARDAAGAIVTFSGVTREVDRLDYEAYGEMAEERIAAILAEAHASHGLEAIAAEHRVGSVPLGEPSVIVAASSAHRPEAFAAAREAIDRIKAEAPIWKREVEGEEGRWVQGTRPA